MKIKEQRVEQGWSPGIAFLRCIVIVGAGFVPYAVGIAINRTVFV